MQAVHENVLEALSCFKITEEKNIKHYHKDINKILGERYTSL